MHGFTGATPATTHLDITTECVDQMAFDVPKIIITTETFDPDMALLRSDTGTFRRREWHADDPFSSRK